MWKKWNNVRDSTSGSSQSSPEGKHYFFIPEAGNAAFLVGTAPLWTAVLTLLFSKDSFSAHIFMQPTVWGNLLFLGLVASLACFLAWNLVMDRLGNVTSTNYVYLNPIFTLLSAMSFLGERLTPAAAIGSAVILLGVIWAGKKKPTNIIREK